ncbi:MAG: hypothetical protein AB8F94_02185 [Saprospiraceae bacterium]
MKLQNLNTFTLLLFFFLSGSSFLSAQKTIIQGRVLLDGVENAEGALITLQDSLYDVVNENGEYFYELDEPLKSYRFFVSYLGYETLDTTILNNPSNILRFDFSLKKKINEAPEVIVTEKRELNLFKKGNWTILDMVLFEESFFLIAIEKGKRYLFRYDKEGIFLEKQKMKKISAFNISCFGSLYVMAKKSCFQLEIEDEIKIKAEILVSEFDDKLKPCIAFYDANLIFENFSKHNKMKNYVRIWNKGERKKIATIFDEQAARLARSSYNKIIGAYSGAIANPDENSINYAYGSERINIVADGTWDGDLTRLIVDNALQQMVSYFLNVQSRPIHVLDFFYEGRLYLLDYVNQEFLSFDANNEFLKEKIDFDFDWQIKLELLYSKSNETVYFYAKNDIYEFEMVDAGLQIVKVASIPGELYFNKIVGADDDFVYVLGQEDRVNPKMVVKRYAMD